MHEKIIACGDCGTAVHCPNFTNRCPRCGAFYNFSGQRLSDPSNWGEETGERFDEVGNFIPGYGDDEYDPGDWE